MSYPIVEIPRGVVLSRKKETPNYEIDRQLFNQETIGLLMDMASSYPEHKDVFRLLRQELNGRFSLSDFNSPNRLSFDDIFDIISCFPARLNQYRLLRHFLFQPDLNLRHKAAIAIDMHREDYSREINTEFDVIVHNDPDEQQRLIMWLNGRRSMDRRHELYEYLEGVPISPLIKDERITEEKLEQYFYPYNNYSPLNTQIKAINNTKEHLYKRSREASELMKAGKKDEAQKIWSALADEYGKAVVEIIQATPNVEKMLGQLWRLPQSQIIQVLSFVLMNPDEYRTLPDQTEEQIEAFALLASTFINDRRGTRVFINQVLERNRWKDSPIVAKALARVAYILPVEEIMKSIMPVVLKHKDSKDQPVGDAVYSLCYAISRDITHKEVPGPKQQIGDYLVL